MRILITGGAGFIGCHAAHRFAAEHDVTILDNLSRQGAAANLEWLKTSRRFHFLKEDIRNAQRLREVVASIRPEVVLHLASQVAVTTSVRDPRTDFEINATGTLNVLEALREKAPDALLLYASTNKVYGGMEDVAIALCGERYQYVHLTYGVGEDRLLDFHSPYGCSKGAADQYVRDYARIYGLHTAIFRQSCIYGTRQFGVEDQGWLAWFAISAVLGRPITIFGDGYQVRDVLWIDDLVDAYQAAMSRSEQMRGRIYNIGGGPANQISLRQSIQLLERLLARPITLAVGPARQGDQRVFVADTRLAERELNWKARTSPAEGIARLLGWVQDHQHLLRT